MDALKTIGRLRLDVVEYISSKFPFHERGRNDLNQQLINLLSQPGRLFQDPVLQLVRPRLPGKFDQNLFHSTLHPKLPPTPYAHQIKAWHRLSQGMPTVVATGTGSGKSECFMFPMIDGLIKAEFAAKGPRVGAICLYPMNALVEDQFFRLLRLTAGTGITVGIYNGTYNKLSGPVKKKIMDRARQEKYHVDPSTFFVDPKDPRTIPHILLTNYKMLEYMLLRTEDHRLFEGADLRYLVLDEAHTYTGTLGLEIACLLARLRVHLGPASDGFVPVATSATLIQGSHRRADQTDESDKTRGEMRRFFSQLFGKSFPDDTGWLIEDEYVPLPNIDPQVLTAFAQCSVPMLRQALDKANSAGLCDLAKTLGITIPSLSVQGTESSHEAYDTLARAIYPTFSKIAGQLAAVVLTRDDGPGVDSVVSWSDAVRRFVDRVGGDAVHLEALLTLASQAYEDRRLPTLGLRVHLFGRSEPRIYWSFDGKNITDEAGAQSLGKATGAFMSCRRCGHMAWGGILTPADVGGGEGGYFEPLPAFYEDHVLPPGSQLVVLHNPDDIQDDPDIEGGIAERKSWSLSPYRVTYEEGRTIVRPVGSKSGAKPGDAVFIRVERTNSEGEDADDVSQCPACGGTSAEGDQAVLMTPRSGAATDLGVYTSSVMTNLDLPHERKLLIFADNRQETSFLAGFLTNRHRRLNLRRIIASFLKAAADSPSEQGGHSWRLMTKIDEEEHPEGHKYDFAARVLLSLVEKKFWGREPLPRKLMVSKRVLQEIIPRDALDIDYLDRKNQDQAQTLHFKDWLLGNINLDQVKNNGGEHDPFSVVDVFGSDRGQWALQTLHEVILLEISAVVGREGNLRTLGLVGWNFPKLTIELFEEWVKEHPHLGLGAQGLFLLSQWLMGKLAENGQWQKLSDSTRRHILGRRGKLDAKTLGDLLGKGFETSKGISKNSTVARLIIGSGGDQALKIWSKAEPWKDLMENGPLKEAVSFSDGRVPRLKTEKAFVIGNPARYRGSMSGVVVAVDPRMQLDGQPTGRKGDVWQRYEGNLHEYYRSFYQRSFEEDARLVRAHEHNGMIGGELASEVIESFARGEINTLVATPTLEMGVDLADLPAVFHRSVPPDPSNYAQRSGRAGREPKRAIIVTHCGAGSHDLTFYQDPKGMVSGEILPPGLPAENLSIISRHVNGLVLEVLARRQSGGGAHLNITWWGDLVDLNPLRTEVLRYQGVTTDFDTSEPKDWLQILTGRTREVEAAVTKFTDLLTQGLWASTRPERLMSLRQGVLAAGQPDRWAQAFRKELETYLGKCQTYVGDFAAWMNKKGTIDTKEAKTLLQQQQRAFKIVEMYLTRNEHNYPLSYLGMCGFLPNFDFPGRSIRFVGVSPQFTAKEGKYAKAGDQYLTFTRAAAVALREFAPEQKVYGQGFVYKVDRYEADPRAMEAEKSWGICVQGCSELTEPEQSHCKFCGGELVRGTEQTATAPLLVEISGVQGLQEKVISDREGRRAYNPMVKEVRHRGIPKPDEAYGLNSDSRIHWQLHMTPSAQIRTATILSGVMAEGPEASTPKMKPLYRELGDENARVFRVHTNVPVDPPEGVRYEAFLPTVWGEGQALLFTLPFDVAVEHGWIPDGKDSGDQREQFYVTFSQLISRAAIRVLRINKRKGSLQFLNHKINETAGDGSIRSGSRSLLILDSEEGGSGVISLLWDYWDQILDEAERLVLSPCCRDKCYSCLMSYDNQYDHPLLNKGLFIREDNGQKSAPLFTAVKRFQKGELNIHHVEANRELPVDAKSPAEAVLEELLRKDFGHARETQISIRRADGREVTRPDFEISSGAGDNVCIFVDGWTHHKLSIRSDMAKRNHVARQHQRVMVLPARLLVPKAQESVLVPLLQLLKRSEGVQVPCSEGFLGGLPFKTVQEEFRKDISFSGLRPEKWQIVDHPTLIAIIEKLMPKELTDGIASLERRHWPVGYQNGILLWPLYAEELEKDSSGQTWESVLIFQSVLAGLGVVNIFVEAKRDGSSRAA